MDSSITNSAANNCSREPNKVVSSGEVGISVEEWRGWGPTSTVPSMVTQVIVDLNLLEENVDAHMVFRGNHGKLSVKVLIFLVHSSFLYDCFLL